VDQPISARTRSAQRAHRRVANILRSCAPAQPLECIKPLELVAQLHLHQIVPQRGQGTPVLGDADVKNVEHGGRLFQNLGFAVLRARVCTFGVVPRVPVAGRRVQPTTLKSIPRRLVRASESARGPASQTTPKTWKRSCPSDIRTYLLYTSKCTHTSMHRQVHPPFTTAMSTADIVEVLIDSDCLDRSVE
jgi:hypothetical protein